MSFKTSHIFLIALISIIYLPVLFMQGMFMDGLIYSAIAENLSLNFNGSFHLFVSETFLSDFHEQPPLVFFLQALVIKLFYDVFFVDRLYSFLSFFLSLYLLYKIASKYTSLKENAWIVIMAFLFIPVVSWSYKNNMLENTMCVFTLWSVYISFDYYILKSKNLLIFTFQFSFMLWCSFMSKGFTGLFPFSIPFLFHLFYSKKTNHKWFLETVLLLLAFSLIVIVPFLLSPAFYNYVKTYFLTQVVASVNGNREVDGHFFIVKRVPQELLILIIVTLILNLKYGKNILVEICRKIKSNKPSQFFLVLALFGSLPIMISPKQSGYYVLCSYPFFALFFALINKEEILALTSNLKLKLWEGKFRILLVGLIITSVSMSLFNWKRFYRDDTKIMMIDLIEHKMPHLKSIDISWDFAQDYSLYAYFARRHNVSLYTPNYQNTKSIFLISKTLNEKEIIKANYLVNNEKIYLFSK